MDVAGFLAVATLVVMTPGPDMTLVARNTFASGRLSGLATSAGTCSGLLVHATAAARGLSAVLVASSQAFTVVKIAGGAYLIFLGIRTIIGAGREVPPGDRAKAADPWTSYPETVERFVDKLAIGEKGEALDIELRRRVSLNGAGPKLRTPDAREWPRR